MCGAAVRAAGVPCLCQLRAACVLDSVAVRWLYVAVRWLCGGCAVAARWLCSGCAVAVRWLCGGCAVAARLCVAVRWLCGGCAVAGRLCRGRALAVQWLRGGCAKPGRLCHGCAVAVRWLCGGCAVAVPGFGGLCCARGFMVVCLHCAGCIMVACAWRGGLHT